MFALMPNHREELAAMVVELQSNRAVLDGLTNWYGVFVFTGGRVPTAHWNLIAMTSYLEHPSAAECRWTSGIEHYRRLAQAISDMGQTGAGPRTLRCRHDMGDEFSQASSEIRLASDSLVSSMTKAMKRYAIKKINEDEQKASEKVQSAGQEAEKKTANLTGEAKEPQRHP